MTSTDSTTIDTITPAPKHPHDDGLMRNFYWLNGNYGHELFLAACYGMWEGLIDPGQAPAHERRTLKGRDVLRNWLNEHGVIKAYRQNQVAQAEPIACPNWCTVEHGEGDHLLLPDMLGLRHAVPLLEEGEITAQLVSYQCLATDQEPPEVFFAGLPTDGSESPEQLRKVAQAYLSAADAWDAMQDPS